MLISCQKKEKNETVRGRNDENRKTSQTLCDASLKPGFDPFVPPFLLTRILSAPPIRVLLLSTVTRTLSSPFNKLGFIDATSKTAVLQLRG